MSNNIEVVEEMEVGGGELDANKNERMFTLKKWNAVAMWSWDVECDTCAICRVQVMGKSHWILKSTYLLPILRII